MIKKIQGQLWFCCPKCGKRLFQVAAEAVCSGVFCKCRQCGWNGEIRIGKKGA